MIYNEVPPGKGTPPSLGNSSSGSKLQKYQTVEGWEEVLKTKSYSSEEEKKFWYDFLDKMKEERKNGPIQWRKKPEEKKKKKPGSVKLN
jgi:hypothetical protein